MDMLVFFPLFTAYPFFYHYLSAPSHGFGTRGELLILVFIGEENPVVQLIAKPGQWFTLPPSEMQPFGAVAIEEEVVARMNGGTDVRAPADQTVEFNATSADMEIRKHDDTVKKASPSKKQEIKPLHKDKELATSTAEEDYFPELALLPDEWEY
ncbi:hypothetical protein E2562_021697 [Oryza meyeriana var. granulata]|uniref:Uncharacterized protein n=1 Tax=Oryza meyeriana var. granulata TaxID=110450 RepID=A0A6G1E0I6_9ORYZ|nr:hypothetical protein E2562_021697 [Oryza meyeriana var. granulata]